MKLINNVIFLEFSEMVDCLMLQGNKEREKVEIYLRKEKARGCKWGNFIKDPDHGAKTLVEYDSLIDKYKQFIQQKFGDPYEYIAKQPIKQLVKKDFKAEQYFIAYRFDGEKCLPTEHINKYITAASWLNTLNELNKNKKLIKKQLNLTIDSFWIHVTEIIKTEKIDLPTSYKRLRMKMQEYSEKGYDSLIDWRFGNKLAAKVSDEVSENQLLFLIENAHQPDDVMVCAMYNNWATGKGYKTISPATVTNWRNERGYQVTAGREGNSAFNEKYIRQVKGLLPSVPLALVEHDDNNLDFLFKDEDGYQFNKYVAIVVIDSRTKLVLGKSYTVGQTPGQWQVYHAYLDAMYYIRSLTGGWHLPFEIKADRWASKAFTPFYNKIAKFVPPSHGNKHRGYIEPFFASPLWKRSQKLVSDNNWSGNNMTAKYRGVNTENLTNNAKARPMIGEQAELQIENFFHLLRNMPDFTRDNMNAPSKEQQFLEQWNKLSLEDKRPISDEQFLLTFGIKHQPKHRSGITINNRGVEPQISNCKYSYDLPESWMYNKLIGEKVEVYYDPYDMSRILVTNHQDIRFIAKTAELSPRALKDTYTGSRTFLNSILAEKKEQVKQVADGTERRKLTVDASRYNAEAMLQGNVLVKEIKNGAEQKYLEDFHQQRESWLDETHNFNEFF